MKKQQKKIRKAKTAEEILKIKKACEITDQIFNKLIENFKKFKTDKAIIKFIKNEATKNNCKLAFKPIIASGKNSSEPHYEAKGNRLQKGFCVIDFGVRYKGFCSDMTRTIYIGKPSKKEIKLYESVLNLQKKALKLAKPGVMCSKLDKTIRNKFGKNKKQFIHGSGHGIGKKVHDLPTISPKSKDILKENDVVAIEPALYFKGKFGIRIEDDLVAKKNKAEILTKSTKELITIKK